MIRNLYIFHLLFFVMLSLSVSYSVAQSSNARLSVADYEIPQTSDFPVIDGEFSLEEWQDALMVDLHNETNPSQNIPALVETQAYLMEDGDNFLLAFVAHDPDPSKIRAFYRDRDRSWQDDRVGVVLDTFNDERRAYEFFVNPLGIQMDQTNDDVSRRTDNNWNAIWDSAGKINETGYVVEMRIPLQQIRFPSGQAEQVWGIDLLRFYPRDVRHRLSNNLTDYGVACYLCLLTKASGFPNVEQGTNLLITPSVTSLWAENRPDPLVDSWQSNDLESDAGVDVRWGINEDMILNATLNPDFSQVEADNAQLDINNTFTLFFQEKRDFFLDGAEYFNTQVNLLHTRNIQDPDAGIKLTGKNGDHSYGVLFANDQRTAFILPGVQGSQIAVLDDTTSENVALRYRYDHGAKLTLGTLFTHRQADDYDNSLASVDMNWRFRDSDRLNAQVMVSQANNPLVVQNQFGLQNSQSDYAYRVVYNHNGENLGLNLRAFHFGEDFRADLGSITRVGFTHLNLNPSYRWRMRPQAFLTEVGLWGFVNYIEDAEGNRREDTQRIGLWMNGPMQSNFETGGATQQKLYNNAYYETGDRFIWFQFRPWGGARFSSFIEKAKAIDYANSRAADSFTFTPSFSLQLGRHLQAQVDYTYQNLDVAEGQLYKTQLLDARLTYQFNSRSFIRATLIHSDTTRDPSLYSFPIDEQSSSLTSQLLYSYRMSARTRFFIGYSDQAFENDNLDALEKTSRAVFAKFSYAWQY